jgi:hypothetical protein
MFVSTKLGTIVKLLSGGKFSTSERLSAPEPPDGGLTRLGIAALALYQGGELSPQERGNRQTTLGSEHARLSKRLFIEGECDVSSRGHEKTCST